eukprot:1275008-Pyramimonas_sp.AAC.1
MARSRSNSMTRSSSPRLWSRCGQCKRCEWNDVLSKLDNKCVHCACDVTIFKPKGSKVRSSSRDRRVSFSDNVEMRQQGSTMQAGETAR